MELPDLAVVTVALDVRPADALPFIDVLGPNPAQVPLIDTTHVTAAALGFLNVPMACWIDETGRIVRPAEQAIIERTGYRDRPITEDMPDRLKRMMAEVSRLPEGDPQRYRAALADFAAHGADSRYALSPDEVRRRSGDRDVDKARAAACFALGEHLRRARGADAAVAWWREAHRLDPDAWNYKRQAWTMVTTPADAAEPDLIQGPNDVYAGNWLDDVLAAGGGEHYYPPQNLG